MRKDFGVKPWFYPLPVLIIGTYDENGTPNAMNAAWGGLYDENLVELCLGADRKTTQNILAKKAFTISLQTLPTLQPAIMSESYPAITPLIKCKKPVLRLKKVNSLTPRSSMNFHSS